MQVNLLLGQVELIGETFAFVGHQVDDLCESIAQRLQLPVLEATDTALAARLKLFMYTLLMQQSHVALLLRRQR